MFIEQLISILERKNACEIFSFAVTRIHLILKYIKIENSYFSFVIILHITLIAVFLTFFCHFEW